MPPISGSNGLDAFEEWERANNDVEKATFAVRDYFRAGIPDEKVREKLVGKMLAASEHASALLQNLRKFLP